MSTPLDDRTIHAVSLARRSGEGENVSLPSARKFDETRLSQPHELQDSKRQHTTPQTRPRSSQPTPGGTTVRPTCRLSTNSSAGCMVRRRLGADRRATRAANSCDVLHARRSDDQSCVRVDMLWSAFAEGRVVLARCGCAVRVDWELLLLTGEGLLLFGLSSGIRSMLDARCSNFTRVDYCVGGGCR